MNFHIRKYLPLIFLFIIEIYYFYHEDNKEMKIITIQTGYAFFLIQVYRIIFDIGKTSKSKNLDFKRILRQNDILVSYSFIPIALMIMYSKNYFLLGFAILNIINEKKIWRALSLSDC